jgi:regulatory protein
VRALARRDHSGASLGARLERAGIAAREREEAVESAVRSGLVDDARFAQARAEHLAARAAGDAMILDDLERQGVDEPIRRAAVAALEPEEARAARVLARRGTSLRTIRYLAARGFSEESVESLVADRETGALP